MTFPFFIGAIVLLLILFFSSGHMFSQTKTLAGGGPLTLPQETHLTESADMTDVAKTMAESGNKKVVSLTETKDTENPKPDTYVIKKGDTITSISKKFDVSIYDLIRANKITDPRRLKANDTIMIPAGSIGGPRKGFTEMGKALPDDVAIMASAKSGTSPLKTQFFITTKLDSKSLEYLWDLGNDRYSFDENPRNTYSSPGVYSVYVIVSDSNKNEVVSNKVNVEVRTRELRRIHIDSALPRYFTFTQVNDLVDLSAFAPGNGHSKADGDLTVTQNPEIFKDAGENKFVSVKPGYSEITLSAKNTSYTAHVFVSPFPSKHSFEPEYDWYKTQFATGINGNCGPACVAMAIQWATGDDIAVAKVRHEIGLPYQNGAIEFSHMSRSFGKHDVHTKSVTINGMDDIRRIVDSGDIAIVVFDTRSIQKTRNSSPSNFVGRYYDDITGHYIVLKGYSLDGKYVIAYDPMPSDWVSNGTRYADGSTMLGKNRYYPVSELLSGMGKEAFEISR